MGNPSGSRGEAAYARAMAAFQEGSLDAAKRLVSEALADDPHHPGARALRTRIDARLSSGYPGPGRPSAGRGGAPEATSVDPTILIDRATQRAPDYVEPTVLIQRDDLPGYGSPRHDVPRHDPPRHDPPRRREERESDPFPPPSSRSARSAPAPEPTILIAPKKKNPPASSSSRAPSPSGLQLLWLRLTGGGGASPASQRSSAGKGGSSGRQAGTGLSPAARGALLAVGGLVVAAVFVFGIVALVRSVWTPGNVLTLTKPVGGTLVGAGLSCGSRGSECSTTKASTETVELQAVADSGYVFSGFTGDCAPSGRVSMSQARSCGATFGQVTDGGASAGVAWPLTITKPTGGTVVAAGGIICGTLGSTCEIKLPDGAPVTLTFEADANFQFLNFTGDCAASGETIMSAARTCGATFTPTEKQVVSVARPSADPPRSGTRPAAPPPGGATTKPAPVAPNPVATGQAPPAVTTIPPSAPTPTAPAVTVAADKPPPPESEEDHAKKEIAQLVKNYCAELETLQAARVHKIFPTVDQRTLRDQFSQYKSLKCTLAGPPEYDRIDVKGAGGAQLKVGMKQTIATKSGGAPQTVETIVTMIVSRIDNRSAWTIDRVKHESKPK